MNKPNCVMIGAAKAGTTSLYVYLSEHPDVFLPQQLKEINYFSGANDRIKTESEYLSLYNGSEKFPVRMDISTTYLYDAETPKKIRELLGPDAKIIVFLRNPVDASYSLWKQMKHFGTEPLSFEEAVATEQKRVQDRDSLQGWPPNYFYTERFKYAPQIQRYLDHFSRDQISVFIFEEFFGTLEEKWNGFCQSIGVPSFRPSSLGVVHNPAADGFKSSLIRDIIVKDLWWKKPVVKLMPASLKNRLRLKLDDWNKSGSETPLGSELRRRLQAEFGDDVRVLEKMLGRKLDQIWF